MAENDNHYNDGTEADQTSGSMANNSANMNGQQEDNNAQPRLLLPFPGTVTPAYPGNGSGTNSGNGSGMNSGGSFDPNSGGGCPSCGWLPAFPGFPSMMPQYYSQVRFLNASTNSFTVNISIDNTAYAINSRFGTVSNYDRVTDGFHTVTVRRASGMRSILLQQTFPFVAGQKVTFVLTDSASGGLEMIRVIDSACNNLPSNSGCYRFANMSYSDSRVDLLLNNGETIFRNVGFQQVTSYKQAVAGSYQFMVVSSSSMGVGRELQIIVIGVLGTASGTRTPLLTFSADIAAGRSCTSYLIGNTWSANSLQVLTVTD